MLLSRLYLTEKKKTSYSICVSFLKTVLLSYFFLYKKAFVGLICVTLVLIISDLLVPWTFKVLIDHVLEDTPIDTRSALGMLLSSFQTKEALGFFVVMMFFFLRIVREITTYARSLYIKKIAGNLIYRFSKNAFDNLEKFAIGYYRNQKIGDYIYRLSTDIAAVGELIEDGIFPLLSSTLTIISIIGILLLINVKLGVYALLALPFLVAGLFLINKKIVLESKRSEHTNSAVFSFLQQALTQLKIIQAYTQEKQELQQFNKTMFRSLRSSFSVQNVHILLSLCVGIIIAVSYALVIGFGIQAVFAGEITVGILLVFIFYLDALTDLILTTISSIGLMKSASVKIARMMDFFDQTSHIIDNGTVTTVSNTTITFKHVTLKTPDERVILDNISCTIPKNKITVILGVNGAGKTSFVSLIPRLINEPTAGTVLIGKHSVKDYTVKTLREHIAYVPQEILLFNSTIKDIIAFGKEHATLKEIQEAAQLAVADEFINKKKSGYNFLVGEEGNYLSGGQRQRLMLARAFIKNATIMILDEVFSSQDLKTRFMMLENLRKIAGGKTIVIVSNSLEVVSEADYVIALSNGKVSNEKTHAELLKEDLLKPANYYKLFIEN